MALQAQARQLARVDQQTLFQIAMRQPRRLRTLEPRDRALKRGSRRRKAVPWRPIAKDISARRVTVSAALGYLEREACRARQW